MKIQKKLGAALLTIGVMTTASAYAKCPPELSGDELNFCLTLEGSGKSYEQYIKARAEDRKVDPSGVAAAERGKTEAVDSGWISASGGNE